MRHLSGRGGKAAYDVSGNVIWLSCPGKNPRLAPADPVASLKRNMRRLVDQIERSGRLKADIEAAIGTRRYELYRGCATSGARATEHSFAAAQRLHVGSLLKFLHAVAAAGSDSGDRAASRDVAAQLNPLTRSIRKLEASVLRARQLSRDVLAQCQRRDGPAGG